MSIEQQVLEGLRALPVEQQQQVLDYLETLRQDHHQSQEDDNEPNRQTAPEQSARMSHRDLKGMFSHLNIHITEEDIAQARREMWGNFPRDIEY